MTGEGILLCFLLLFGMVGICVGFFVGGWFLFLTPLCLWEPSLVEWDGKIWRLPIFEIELFRRRIVPNIRSGEAE